ncbi:MAG: hypothetical protein ACTSRH_09590 [Promethearchaeota archaeon]
MISLKVKRFPFVFPIEYLPNSNINIKHGNILIGSVIKNSVLPILALMYGAIYISATE